MIKVNIKEIEERRRQSPNGKFGRASKDISIALGRDPESFDLRKRHPFDLALIRIPGGKTLCPYHSHSAESELYLVVSGQGSVRDKDGTTMVTPGTLSFSDQARHISFVTRERKISFIMSSQIIRAGTRVIIPTAASSRL
jgi:mannose-6-phosphate isomerase-like protein (cupin superfamily)